MQWDVLVIKKDHLKPILPGNKSSSHNERSLYPENGYRDLFLFDANKWGSGSFFTIAYALLDLTERLLADIVLDPAGVF